MSHLRYLGFIAALAFSVMFTNTAAAQINEVRLGSAGYEFNPKVRKNDTAVSFNTFRASALAPIEVVPKQTFAFVGVNYQLMNATVSGPALESSDLHLIALNTMLAHKLSDKWFGVLAASYGIASDLRAPLTGSDFFVTGTGILMYRLTPSLMIGPGITYDSRTGNVIPLPMGALYWEPVPRFAIRGAIPANIYAAWRPVDPLTLQALAGLEGQRYHVTDDRFEGKKAALAYSVLRLGVGARVHFNRYMHLEATGGLLALRRFETFVNDDSQGNAYLPAGGFAGLSFWFGTSGWKDDMQMRAP